MNMEEAKYKGFLFEYYGDVYTPDALTKKLGIDFKDFMARMRRGDFTVEEAVIQGRKSCEEKTD